MKKIVVFTLIINLYGAIITGNQDKVSTIGGSVEVSSGGKSVIVNSGEITFYKNGSSPTNPRKLQKGDLDDIESDLSASDIGNIISIFYPPLNKKVVDDIKSILIKNKIDKNSIDTYYTKDGVILRVLKIEIEGIKNIYPRYYRQLKAYIKKKSKTAKSSKGKVPTLKLRKRDIRRFHRDICKRYGC